MNQGQRVKFETYNGEVKEGYIVSTMGSNVKIQEDIKPGSSPQYHTIAQYMVIEHLPKVKTPPVSQMSVRHNPAT